MAGYCPHCGHQVEIGECPECGLQVTTERILRKPPKRNRTRGWLIVLIAIGAVGLLGYLSYAFLPWASKAPIGMLAKLQFWGSTIAERELVGRVMGGSLSKSELNEALDTMISFNFLDRPPFTHDGHVALFIQPKISVEGLFSRHWVYFSDVVVEVDGERNKDMWTYGSSKLNGFNLKLYFVAMPVGKHTIHLKCKAILAPQELEGPAIEASAKYETRVDISKSIEVDSRGAAEFYKPVTGPEVKQDSSRVYFEFQKKDEQDKDGKPVRHHWLLIHNQMHRFEMLSGKVYARPSGKGEYTYLNEVILRNMARDWFSLDNVPEIASADRIDVKVEPSPIVMVSFAPQDITRYIGETIERVGIFRNWE
jgi:hypothetical protein